MPDRMRFGRTPDAVFTLAFMALLGFSLAAAGYLPESVEEMVPEWVGLVWAVTLAGGALLSLIGLYWPNELHGWALELGGRPGLMMASGGYAVAIFMVQHDPGTYLAMGLFLGVAAASAWRIYQLMRRLTQFRSAMIAQKRVGGRQ